MKRFAIQTLACSGVGDQLGTQFSTLYQLGIALGYTYAHLIPFQFYRSYRLSALEKAIRVIAQTKISSGLRTHLQFYSRDLGNFLGVNNLNYLVPNTSKDYVDIFDIDLGQIIQNFEIRNLADLKFAIEDKTSHINSDQITLLFNWNLGMHQYLSKFHLFLEEASHVSQSDVNFFFSQHYWKARKSWKVSLPFDTSNNKIKIVLHVRLGDSTTVEIGERRFFIHGDRVFTNLSDLMSVLSIDPNRSPIQDQFEYSNFLDQLFLEYGENNFCCVVLSDGYEATFKAIREAHQIGQINLTKQELKQLPIIKQKLNKQLYKQFNKYKNINIIIGESNQKLYQSIHALASCDVVIFGTGGFAFYMHHLFKEPDKESLLINIRDYKKETFELIGQMLST